MSIVKTYDAKKVLVAFANIPLTGFADDTFVTVEFDEDSFTKKIGVSGEVVRSMSNNRGAKVTVVLMQQSQTNDVLSAIALADRLSGLGVGLLSITELNGTSRVFGEAWIQKTPNMERGKEAGNVSWVFDMAEAEMNIGGLLL